MMKQDPQSEELISQTAFAERIGVSRDQVKIWIGQGLPLKGRRVPVPAAEAWLKDNVLPRYRATHCPEVGAQAIDEPSLMELRRRREQQKIEAGALELRVRKGELIERRTVQLFIAARARMERDQWLSWSSGLAARIAATLHVDHARLFALIEDEVRAQLRFLSETPLQDAGDGRVA
jgi:hypothetical protein